MEIKTTIREIIELFIGFTFVFWVGIRIMPRMFETTKEWMDRLNNDDLIKHIDIEMSYYEKNERNFNKRVYPSLKKLKDKLLNKCYNEKR